MNYRNFTGDDLAIAEQAMNAAYDIYLQRKERYDYSISQGHDGYARRNHLDPMNEAWKNYEQAKIYYEDIVKSIDAANNTAYKTVQQQYVSEALVQDATGEVKQNDYTAWIYIAIAVLVIAFFWKK